MGSIIGNSLSKVLASAGSGLRISVALGSISESLTVSESLAPPYKRIPMKQ